MSGNLGPEQKKIDNISDWLKVRSVSVIMWGFFFASM
jgi:hypothetical protein